jgi:hypothetical protein
LELAGGNTGKGEAKQIKLAGWYIYFLPNKSPDFIANLHFLGTEEGGRLTPANDGYFPQVKLRMSVSWKYKWKTWCGTGRDKRLDATGERCRNKLCAMFLYSCIYDVHKLKLFTQSTIQLLTPNQPLTQSTTHSINPQPTTHLPPINHPQFTNAPFRLLPPFTTFAVHFKIK